jgi:nucleotide-binding universal stress UspA family protein
MSQQLHKKRLMKFAEITARDGNAGNAIVQEAKGWNAHVIFGSVSHYVVDNASCPVEVLHQRHGEH